MICVANSDDTSTVSRPRDPLPQQLSMLLEAAREMFAWLRQPANQEASNLFVHSMEAGGTSKTFLLHAYEGQTYAKLDPVWDDPYKIRTIASYLAGWLNNEAAAYASGLPFADVLRAYKSE